MIGRMEGCDRVFHTRTRHYKKVGHDYNHLDVISRDIKKNKTYEEK